MATTKRSRAKPKAPRSKDELRRYHTPPLEDAPPLLFGPYHPPACRIGDWINDEVLGLVEVSGWTDGPMPWPKRKRPGLPTIIFTDDLVRAIRSESARAVAGAWGFTPSTVTNWRRALDAERFTPGTTQLLQSNYDAEQGSAALAKGRATIAANPAIRQGIAEKKRGVKHSADAREKISAGLKGRPKAAGWGAMANAWMLEGKARRR